MDHWSNSAWQFLYLSFEFQIQLEWPCAKQLTDIFYYMKSTYPAWLEKILHFSLLPLPHLVTVLVTDHLHPNGIMGLTYTKSLFSLQISDLQKTIRITSTLTHLFPLTSPFPIKLKASQTVIWSLCTSMNCAKELIMPWNLSISMLYKRLSKSVTKAVV